MTRALLALILGTALFAGLACNEDSVWVPRLRGQYLEPTSPEALVDNLAEAYTWQEIDGYTPILAPEFVFKFQPTDAQDLGFDSWTRDEDSTGTAGLFATPEVGNDIRIDLPHNPSTVSAEPFPGVEGEVRFIRIQPTQLQVDIIGGSGAGVTLNVYGDIQDMFFRRGNAAAGEDTTRWFLFEWRDLPGPFLDAAATDQAVAATGGAVAAVEAVTWGRIKYRYAVSASDAAGRNQVLSFEGGTP